MKILIVGFRESFTQIFGDRWNEKVSSLKHGSDEFIFWEIKLYAQLDNRETMLPDWSVTNGVDLIVLAVYGDDSRTLILDSDGRFRNIFKKAEERMSLSGSRKYF